VKKYIDAWLLGALVAWFMPFFKWTDIKDDKSEKLSNEEKQEHEKKVHKLFRRYVIIWACCSILLVMYNFYVIWAMFLSGCSICIINGFTHCYIVLMTGKAKKQDYILVFYNIITSVLLGYTIAEVIKKLIATE
jgi:hypothetical protein